MNGMMKTAFQTRSSHAVMSTSPSHVTNNGSIGQTAQAMHEIPASLCGLEPSATDCNETFNEPVHSLLQPHYNWARETNKMPCSQCGGASEQMSLQFEPQPQLREEP